jgi:hypothetical protein
MWNILLLPAVAAEVLRMAVAAVLGVTAVAFQVKALVAEHQQNQH